MIKRLTNELSLPLLWHRPYQEGWGLWSLCSWNTPCAYPSERLEPPPKFANPELLPRITMQCCRGVSTITVLSHPEPLGNQFNWTCPIPKFFLPGLQLSPEFHMLSKPNRTPPSAWWLPSPPWRCKTLSIWTQCPQLLWNPEVLPQVVVEVLLFSNFLLVWEYARESRKLADYRNQLDYNLTKSACQV